MQIILEILSGPTAGQNIRLQRGQVVNVGSSAWNDFVVPDDSEIAPKHFVIDLREGICRFRDMSGDQSASVNGQPVTTSILKDGDQIRAGASDFHVRIVGEAANPRTAMENRNLVPAPGKSPPHALNGNYFFEHCSKGVCSYTGSVDEIAPTEIAELINARQSLYLLIDTRRAELPSLPDLNPSAFLFDWLGKAAETNSPVLLSEEDVSSEECGDLPSVLESAWGKDAAIAMYCKSSQAELLEVLRKVARPKPDSFLGFCWPSLLYSLLANQSPQFDLAGTLFESVSALLIEGTDEKTWVLYTPSPIDDFLKSHGLQPAAPHGSSENKDDAGVQPATSENSEE